MMFTAERPEPVWILEVPVRPEYKHVPGTQTPNDGIWVAFFPGGCGVAGYFMCDVSQNPSELSFQHRFEGELSGDCGGGGEGGGGGGGGGPSGPPPPMTWYVNGKAEGDYLVFPVSTNIYLGGTAIFWATNNVLRLPVLSSWVSAPSVGVDLPKGTTVTVTPTNARTYRIIGTSLADPSLSAEGHLIVSNVSLEMPPYLGIKMTDPIGDPVGFATAKVNADPSASCAWTLTSSKTHFDPEPGNGLTATIKEQGEASGAYKAEEVKALVTQGSVSADLSTNYTVVRIDIEMQDLSEADEETVGGVVWLNSDDDNANGVPDLQEAPVTNENDLVPVVITLYPSGLPGDETVSVAGGNLYEDMEKRTPASSSYPVARFPLTLYVEGKNVSSSPRDKEITVTQDLSGATDKVKYTVFKADITVMPKGWPEDEALPEVVTIGAGAIASEAHQADVEIHVLPEKAGIMVPVRLIDGRCYESGKDAKLAMGAVTAIGGGDAVTVQTGAGGIIDGVLTSSDVIDGCTIKAGTTERFVGFTWDEYDEEGQWTFNPEFLPVPGVLTNYLTLRHHRNGSAAEDPWKPFNDHQIKFFVEQVEYWEDDELKVTNNTPENPADLSAWAHFPETPYVTDADGKVTVLLTVENQTNLSSVTMVAYDWSVYTEPAEQVQPLGVLKFSPMKAGGQPDERNIHVNKNCDEDAMIVELVSDLNNDGKIDDADVQLKEDVSDKGAEFLFVNDNISNGLWDKDDPGKPSGYTADDDIQKIRVKCLPASDAVWFDYPEISKLAFYKNKTCAPSDKMTFPLDLSSGILLPEILYIRAEGLFSSQISGDLILKHGKLDKSVTLGEDKLRLTIVNNVGDVKFFHAVRDYILENNTRLWVGQKQYSPYGMIRIVAMREESTRMVALDTYWRTQPLWGIDAVVANYPGYTVAINANFTFDIQNVGGLKNMTRRCHGRLVSETYNAYVSSDNADPNYPSPTDPLRGSVYAGPDAKYISMPQYYQFQIAKGRVPLSPLPIQAMGGWHTDYNRGNQDQMVGIAEVGLDHRILFTATVVAGSGITASFVEDARQSGVPFLPGGDTDDLMLILGDANTSLALAYQSPADELKVSHKGLKHTLFGYGDYCINTYLLFYSSKPR